MTIGWQEIAVGLVVAFAAAWLVRRAVRARRERVACAHCPVRKIPRPTSPRRSERTEHRRKASQHGRRGIP